MIVSSVLLCSLIAFASGQYQKPSKDAAILSEARYLAVNGQFGSQYKQEDGVEFKEESDGQGNRKGSYSYIDPNGVRRTVSYTAGKDGFRATGDHIPVPAAPAASAAAVAPSPPEQYNSEDDYDDSQPKSYQDQQYNYQYVPQNQQSFAQPQYNPVAQPQPQYNPPQYNPVAQPQPQYNPPQYNAAQQVSFNPVQFRYQSPQIPAHGFTQFTTETPHRLSPPGKLSLNRSPDGYSYTFNQV